MFYKRSIFPQFYEHLFKPEITVLLGPRQAGKTTLLKHCCQTLTAEKVVREQNIFYFNLDLLADREKFINQTEFIKFIKQRLSPEKLYFFIDEAQRVKNCGLFFKGIYDLDWNIKLILSGSSSLEIKSAVSEGLTGRKRIFTLLPFSFTEYYQTQKNLDLAHFAKFSQADQNEAREILADYCLFGGYPKTINQTPEEKIAILDEIFTSYLERDVIGFLNIKKSESFIKLVKILGHQIGQLVNIHELSNTLRIDRKTIEDYLAILKHTFILQEVLPFFRNYRKEITKMPKIYFYDLGLRNFATGSFTPFAKRFDKGYLLENFVFRILKEIPLTKVYFWRTTEQNEVDFLIEKINGELIPIEVKSSEIKVAKISRGYKNFLSFYKLPKAYVVNLNIRKRIEWENRKIVFCLPFELDI